MSDRLKTILCTIPVTLALIAASWWLHDRRSLTADSGASAAATATPVTRYYAYVFGTARDAGGAAVANVTVMVSGKSSTTNASGEWGVSPAVTVGQTYNFEIGIPDGWYLTQWPQSFVASEPPDPIGPFAIVLAPIPAPQPTATEQPTPTATPTATPTFTDPPTPPETTPTIPYPPTVGPSPTKCVSKYQQFSWDERATIISTGYTYIHGGLEEGLDMFTDATLAIGNAQGFGAPLTRAYVVTGDQGEKIVCRGFAYAIVCQRENDPCDDKDSAGFGVVDWGGPMMMLSGGEWGVAP